MGQEAVQVCRTRRAITPRHRFPNGANNHPKKIYFDLGQTTIAAIATVEASY
jgi:hypothetical protein